MAHFAVAVENYMASPVLSVDPSASLISVDELMRDNDVSSVAVVSGDGALMGIISRTDLLRVGKRQAGRRFDAALLTFPASASAETVMTSEVETVSSDTSCAQAAKLMVDKRYHRLFVEKEGQLVGAFSPFDVMRMIVDAKLNKSIADFMSSPLFTVRVEEPISLATERLARAKVTGLVVMEGEFPVGVFAQREALEFKDVANDTPVESTMSSALLCLETDTPIHRAAAMAATLGVRRVVAMKSRQAVGILTGLDFAAAVAGS